MDKGRGRIWGFPKKWWYPTTMGGFPTRNDHEFWGGEMGVPTIFQETSIWTKDNITTQRLPGSISAHLTLTKQIFKQSKWRLSRPRDPIAALYLGIKNPTLRKVFQWYGLMATRYPGLTHQLRLGGFILSPLFLRGFSTIPWWLFGISEPSTVSVKSTSLHNFHSFQVSKILCDGKIHHEFHGRNFRCCQCRNIESKEAAGFSTPEACSKWVELSHFLKFATKAFWTESKTQLNSTNFSGACAVWFFKSRLGFYRTQTHRLHKKTSSKLAKNESQSCTRQELSNYKKGFLSKTQLHHNWVPNQSQRWCCWL